MQYEYDCNCGYAFIAAKSVADRNDPEACPKCFATARRREVPSRIRLQVSELSDWNNPHYNHGLGRAVKSTAEAKRIAKSRGLVEVGNENLEKLQAETDRRRAKESEYDLSEINNLGEIRGAN